MRTLLLILVLANLLLFAARFGAFGAIVPDLGGSARPAPITPERLRIVRDAPPTRPSAAP